MRKILGGHARLLVLLGAALSSCSLIADVPAPARRDATSDGDVVMDADQDGVAPDTDAGDTPDDAGEVGPSARWVGELTASGAVAGPDGCAARSTSFCLRSDSTDPAAAIAASANFRVRGILTGGMTP